MTAIQSVRKITIPDYHLVRDRFAAVVAKADKRKAKLWHSTIDVDVAMNSLYYELEHVYIVNESFLVVYEIGSPPYTKDVFLNEILVLRLTAGSDFAVVPAFLERQAMEAGCRLVVVGTALSMCDAALASLYEKQGYHLETYTLVKEVDG